LLPYLDQLAVFQNFSFAQNPPNPGDPKNTMLSMHAFWWDNDQNFPPPTSPGPVVPPMTNVIPRPPAPYGQALFGAEPTISTFICPSAPDINSYGNVLKCVAYGNGVPGYGYNPNFYAGGAHAYARSPGRLLRGYTHYVACGGDFSDGGFANLSVNNPGFEGMFWYKTPRSLGQIPDGTSNTMAFIEWHLTYVNYQMLFGDPVYYPSGWRGRPWSGGFDYTTWGTCPNAQTSLPGDWSQNLFGNNPSYNPCAYYPPGAPYFGIGYLGAGTIHDGYMIHVAMGDGSVHTINPNIAYSIWQALGGYNDGVEASLPD
jgi:hypothetical protein